MQDREVLIGELVAANHVLGREGVCDAYGHISMRDPGDPGRYLLSCSRSPELVAAADIMTFELDGTPTDPDDARRPYLERFIHGAIYEARPDVQAVVHSHSYEVIPFGATGIALRPMQHTCGRIGAEVPVWDIADTFGDTDLLVRDMAQGRDLAATLAGNASVLMRGHGATVCAPSIAEAVLTALYLQVAARMQMDAMRLGEPKYLSPGELEATSQVNQPPIATERAWQYLKTRAGH
jgi:ribulose-5-phosphate 4-epimerase/fuculose-1-phosphate aldolase